MQSDEEVDALEEWAELVSDLIEAIIAVEKFMKSGSAPVLAHSLQVASQFLEPLRIRFEQELDELSHVQ